MSRAIAFERYWADSERPGHPVAESLPPSPNIAGAVAVATALRTYGEGLPALDLDAKWQSLAARLESAPGVAPAVSPGPVIGSGRGRSAGSAGTVSVLRPKLGRTVRAAAAVAAMILLATASLRATPGSTLYPVRLTVEQAALALYPNRGAIHLRLAEARLGDLLVALRQGPVRAAPGLARSLVQNRAAAGRAGADLRELDLRIAVDVPTALVGTPSSIATAVRMILGDLLPPEESLPAQPPAPASGPGDDVAAGSGEKQGSPGRDGLGKESEDRHERDGKHHDDDDGKDEGKDEGHDEGKDEGKDDEGSDKEGSDEGSGSGEGSGKDEGSGDDEGTDGEGHGQDDGSPPEDGSTP